MAGHVESAERPPVQQNSQDFVNRLPLFDGHPRMQAIRSIIEQLRCDAAGQEIVP